MKHGVVRGKHYVVGNRFKVLDGPFASKEEAEKSLAPKPKKKVEKKVVEEEANKED